MRLKKSNPTQVYKTIKHNEQVKNKVNTAKQKEIPKKYTMRRRESDLRWRKKQ